jgi:hypothetical protein
MTTVQEIIIHGDSIELKCDADKSIYIRPTHRHPCEFIEIPDQFSSVCGSLFIGTHVTQSDSHKDGEYIVYTHIVHLMFTDGVYQVKLITYSLFPTEVGLCFTDSI